MRNRPALPSQRVHVRRPQAAGERRRHHDDSFEIEQFWLAAPLKTCEK
ncbi:hypothetical protein [Kaistia sp. 32K]|nr:hypothetical protein [Kaistia sp. 32K]